jgi:hypothetical protein
MNDDQDPYVVYRAWPEETVREALREFNAQMHDDAGVPELQAGLHCFDFLCRRSDLSDELISDIEGAITEARMRITLLQEADAAHLDFQERLDKTRKGVESLRAEVQAIQHRFKPRRRDAFMLGDEYEHVLTAVEQRVRARLATA